MGTSRVLRIIPQLGKKAWRWLTTMKTALVLLFLLAFGAIPGALLPQRSLNEGKVLDYIETNGTVAEIFDKLYLFDVFSSPWFAAIYVLLFISLIGCIIPRTWDHYKAWRAQPPRTPSRLTRIPLYEEGVIECRYEDAQKKVEQKFRSWRMRIQNSEEDRQGTWSLSAERGYMREMWNLIFHLSLVAILLTVAVGRLVYYEGQVIVIAGTDRSTFCNGAVSSYDSFRAGPLVDGTGLTQFCVNVDDFKADYLSNGQATMFSSHIRYATGEDIMKPVDQWEGKLVKVNHPLNIEGDGVYLQGHGYAPTFTITWPNGEKRTETIQFRPDDLVNFLSTGAIRMDPPAGMYPDLYERRQNQIAIQGLFAPTATFSGENNALLTSSYPAMTNPAVAIDIYRGDTGLDAGGSQNIFSLSLAQMHSGALQKLDRVNLQAGESTTLDDGTTITFDGAEEFVNLQIRRDRTKPLVFASAVLLLVSLVASLAVKRRRMWVRLYDEGDGRTRVEIAGISRTDGAGWGKEFRRTAEEILDLTEEELEQDSAEDEFLTTVAKVETLIGEKKGKND